MDEFVAKKYVNPGRLATIYTLLKSTWALLEASPIGEVFKDAEKAFVDVLDDAAKFQGENTSDETEAAKFMCGLNELMIGNPGLFLSKENIKLIQGAVIGKMMPEGVCVLPMQALNELNKIKAFTQMPTIESMTAALDREGYLIHDSEGRTKYQMKINDGKSRGWYIRLGRTREEDEPHHGDGDDKPTSVDPSTRVPTLPAKNEREIKKGKEEKEKAKDIENMGTTGTNKENIVTASDNMVPNAYPNRTQNTDSYPIEEEDMNEQEEKAHLSEIDKLIMAAEQAQHEAEEHNKTPSKDDESLPDKALRSIKLNRGVLTPFRMSMIVQALGGDMPPKMCEAYMLEHGYVEAVPSWVKRETSTTPA